MSKDPRIESLLDLILNDMTAATNRDLACDGPVGNEEGEVWEKIAAKAQQIRNGGEYASISGLHGTGF